jgi:hypothetical protein
VQTSLAPQELPQAVQLASVPSATHPPFAGQQVGVAPVHALPQLVQLLVVPNVVQTPLQQPCPAVQGEPQLPQLLTSVLRFVSQPSVRLVLQLQKPGLHRQRFGGP